MGYHIYTTDGIILKRTPFGEANILLYVLTYDFGLITASAKSVRLSASKLRPALQEYNHISISCIKSKNGWKVTNVIDKGSLFFGYPEYSHKILSQISSVLLKMITGEAPHKEIFEIVRSGFKFLKDVKEEYVVNFEILMVFRILFELGYVEKIDNFKKFLDNITDWNDDILRQISEEKFVLVGAINKALRESHL